MASVGLCYGGGGSRVVRPAQLGRSRECRARTEARGTWSGADGLEYVPLFLYPCWGELAKSVASLVVVGAIRKAVSVVAIKVSWSSGGSGLPDDRV